MLPAGLALNVNFPDNPTGAAWQLTRVGTYNAYAVRFTDNMAKDASPTMRAMAREHGAAVPELPGIAIDMNQNAPSPMQANDEAVVYKTGIAVSPMLAGYDAGSAQDSAVRNALRRLFAKHKK
jgi:5'-nucleotidase